MATEREQRVMDAARALARDQDAGRPLTPALLALVGAVCAPDEAPQPTPAAPDAPDVAAIGRRAAPTTDAERRAHFAAEGSAVVTDCGGGLPEVVTDVHRADDIRDAAASYGHAYTWVWLDADGRALPDAALLAHIAAEPARTAAAVARETARCADVLRVWAAVRPHTYPTCLEARALRHAADDLVAIAALDAPAQGVAQ